MIAVSLCLVLISCSSVSDNTLRFGLSTAAVTLDPRYATDAVSYRITRLLFRALVDFDDQFQPIPDLASWDTLSTTHYRFTLREQGRVFHDGSRLTAVDVKASYDSILAEGSTSPHKSTLDMIESVKVVNKEQVDFFLRREDPLFPGRLVLGILPASLIQQGHDFSQQPVGSGGFRFDAWPEEGRLQLQRTTDGQRLEFIRVAEETVRIMKLLRGEIDIIQGDLSHEMVDWLGKKSAVKVSHLSGDSFTYLGFNLEDPIVGTDEIRQAIAFAIDRDAIIKYLMGARARKASTLLVPDHWAGNPALRPIAYNPARARQLLQLAGYDQQRPLTISYKTSSNPFRIRLATVIQQQLKQVGIELEIRSYDWGTFYADIKEGRFQMYSLSWVGLKLPDIFRYVFHSDSVPPRGANRGRYRNPRADELIETADASSDLKVQAELFAELQALLLRDLPYVPLWYEDQVLATSETIEGYQLSRDGSYDGLNYVSRVNHE